MKMLKKLTLKYNLGMYSGYGVILFDLFRPKARTTTVAVKSKIIKPWIRVSTVSFRFFKSFLTQESIFECADIKSMYFIDDRYS